MQYTETHNVPGLLVLVDFKKAFDSLSWSFIEKALEIFNFRSSIQSWIKKHFTIILFLVFCKMVIYQNPLN